MGRRVLRVEGENDFHVILNLLEVRGFPDGVFVPVKPKEGSQGVEHVVRSLPTWLKESDLERIGVVVDADNSPRGRWNSIRARLEGIGWTDLPQEPVREGSVLNGPTGVRLGVWIMPDNQNAGVLEDFVAALIPDQDALMPLVDGFLDEIPQQHRRFEPIARPKARIHSWLAIQEQPGKPMGQAITARYLDPMRPQVEPFLQWLRRLFVE
jgi:hypothetical protein